MFFTSEGETLCSTMSHVRGCPYAHYYINQAQGGNGISHYYSGSPYQKGYGLGSFLKGLFRLAAPLVKGAAKAVGKQALIAGTNVMSDTLVNNRPFKESVHDQWNASKEALTAKAQESVRKMVGSGRIRKRKRSSHRQSNVNVKRRRTTTTKRKAPKRRKKPKRRRAPRKKRKVTHKKKKKKRVTKKRKVSFVKNDIFG